VGYSVRLLVLSEASGLEISRYQKCSNRSKLTELSNIPASPNAYQEISKVNMQEGTWKLSLRSSESLRLPMGEKLLSLEPIKVTQMSERIRVQG